METPGGSLSLALSLTLLACLQSEVILDSVAKHQTKKGRDAWCKLNEKKMRISHRDPLERGVLQFCHMCQLEKVQPKYGQVWRIMTNLKANRCRERDPEEITCALLRDAFMKRGHAFH